MYKIWSRIIFEASLLTLVTNLEIAKTDTSFLALKALNIFLQINLFYYNYNK